MGDGLGFVFAYAKGLGHASKGVFDFLGVGGSTQEEAYGRTVFGCLELLIDQGDVIVELAGEFGTEGYDLELDGYIAMESEVVHEEVNAWELGTVLLSG